MNIEITEKQRQQMWENLIKEAKELVADIPPNAKTKQQFAEETGMTMDQAKRFLTKMMNEGKIKRVRNKGMYYYYPA